MPQNQIQFQKGMSLDEFICDYGTELKCEESLEQTRWGRGYSCPRCDCENHSTFYRNGKSIGSAAITNTRPPCSQAPFSCEQITVTKVVSRDVFHDSIENQYLSTITKAPYGLELSDRRARCTQIDANDGKMRRSSPINRTSSRRDAYLGGVTSGGKRGRGAKNSGLFMAAVEVDENLAVRYVRFDQLLGEISAKITLCLRAE